MRDRGSVNHLPVWARARVQDASRAPATPQQTDEDPILKQAKALNGHFSKEKIKMIGRPVKCCSTSLATRETQTRTTVRCLPLHASGAGTASQLSKRREAMGNLEPGPAGRRVKGRSVCKSDETGNSRMGPENVNCTVTKGPTALPLLGICPENGDSYREAHAHGRVIPRSREAEATECHTERGKTQEV